MHLSTVDRTVRSRRLLGAGGDAAAVLATATALDRACVVADRACAAIRGGHARRRDPAARILAPLIRGTCLRAAREGSICRWHRDRRVLFASRSAARSRGTAAGRRASAAIGCSRGSIDCAAAGRRTPARSAAARSSAAVALTVRLVNGRISRAACEPKRGKGREPSQRTKEPREKDHHCPHAVARTHPDEMHIEQKTVRRRP